MPGAQTVQRPGGVPVCFADDDWRMDYDASSRPLKSVLPTFSTIRTFLTIHFRTSEVKNQLLFECMYDARFPSTKSLGVLTLWAPSTGHLFRPFQPIPPCPAVIRVLSMFGCPHGLEYLSIQNSVLQGRELHRFVSLSTGVRPSSGYLYPLELHQLFPQIRRMRMHSSFVHVRNGSAY